MSLPEKKAAVFRAVLGLLRQGRPLGDLKVSEIAEAAGIGKGTVYEYFPSREELLRDAMQYSRAQGFGELFAAISGAEGFEARWQVIEVTVRQLLECSSVLFSQVPSIGIPQAALHDICGGPQERADTRRMIGEIMSALTSAAVQEGLAPVCRSRNTFPWSERAVFLAFCCAAPSRRISSRRSPPPSPIPAVCIWQPCSKKDRALRRCGAPHLRRFASCPDACRRFSFFRCKFSFANKCKEICTPPYFAV